MKFQDYYETLGVTRNATAEELKLAFRKLARLHHPDVAQNKIAGEAKFKEINEAYEVLGDPAQRKRSDELGADWQNEDGGPARHRRTRPRPAEPDVEFSGTGFSDFFESFFAGGRDGFGSRRTADPRGSTGGEAFHHPGQDVEADLLVTLDEALHGAARKVSLRRPGMNREAERTDTYQVKIPAGVREGKRIRLTGQGGAGYGNAAAGDLYLRVRLARHPDFAVRAADLHCDAGSGAVGGGARRASQDPHARRPRLDAGASGHRAGSQLRMRALGLRQDDGTRGNIYVTMRERTPHPVSPEERALWTQLAQLSTFKPRKES